MNGPSHEVVAVATGFQIASQTGADLPAVIFMVAGCFLTARLPDQLEFGISIPKPPTPKRLRKYEIKWLPSWSWETKPPWPRWKWGTGHRRVTHYLRTAFLFSILSGLLGFALGGTYYGVYFASGLALGFWMHLVADGMTKTGLPSRRKDEKGNQERIHLLPEKLRFTTGSTAESMIVSVILVLSVLSAYQTYGANL
jgi:hypothetical protein